MSCSCCALWKSFTDFLFKRNSTTNITICKTFSCNCNLNRRRDTLRQRHQPTNLEMATPGPNYSPTEDSPGQPFSTLTSSSQCSGLQKRRKPQAKQQRKVTSVPMIVEIR